MEHKRISITTQPASRLNSPLLRLPAELRNRIYHHIFSHHIIRVVPWQFQTKAISNSPHAYAGSMALFLVCRQTHNAAYALFLATSAFDIMQIESRDDLLVTLKPSRYSAIESCLLDHHIFEDMMWWDWWHDPFDTGIADQEHFGALRTVYVRGALVSAGAARMEVTKYLSGMLKRPALEWIIDA